MLVLSRREGERLVIGDGIVLTIVMCDRAKVRLGIQAPKDMEIMREEVFRRVYGDSKGDDVFGPPSTPD